MITFNYQMGDAVLSVSAEIDSGCTGSLSGSYSTAEQPVAASVTELIVRDAIGAEIDVEDLAVKRMGEWVCIGDELEGMALDHWRAYGDDEISLDMGAAA